MLKNETREQHPPQRRPAFAPFKPAAFSKTWTFFNGDWHDGNAPVMGARSHASWLGTMVFDGARTFEGVTPDLELHCARVNRSAAVFSLKQMVPVEGWVALAQEGIKRFDRNAELYIRPMYWAESGSLGGVRHDSDSTRRSRGVYGEAMPKAT